MQAHWLSLSLSHLISSQVRDGNEGWWSSLVPPSETDAPPILEIISMPGIYPTEEHTKGSGDTLRSASAGQGANGGDGGGGWLGDFLMAMTCCQPQKLGGDEVDQVVKTSVVSRKCAFDMLIPHSNTFASARSYMHMHMRMHARASIPLLPLSLSLSLSLSLPPSLPFFSLALPLSLPP